MRRHTLVALGLLSELREVNGVFVTHCDEKDQSVSVMGSLAECVDKAIVR